MKFITSLVFVMTFLQLCIGLLYISHVKGAILFANKNANQMLEISKKDYCTIFTNLNDIEDLLQLEHRVLEDEEFSTMFNLCFTSAYRKPLNFLTYPGTLWCGFGNIASNFTELGFFENEDQCCRQHDMCPRYITGNTCKYNICNLSPFTSSHCDCDLKFRDCLQALNSLSSKLIAFLYFNTMGISCFSEQPDSPKCPLSEQAEVNCRVKQRQLKYDWFNAWLDRKIVKRAATAIGDFASYLRRALLFNRLPCPL